MSIPLQSQQDAVYAQDVCSYCERPFTGEHKCSRRVALVVHRTSRATSHTRPVNEKGRMLFKPARVVLEEETPDRKAARAERARQEFLEEQAVE